MMRKEIIEIEKKKKKKPITGRFNPLRILWNVIQIEFLQ